MSSVTLASPQRTVPWQPQKTGARRVAAKPARTARITRCAAGVLRIRTAQKQAATASPSPCHPIGRRPPNRSILRHQANSVTMRISTAGMCNLRQLTRANLVRRRSVNTPPHQSNDRWPRSAQPCGRRRHPARRFLEKFGRNLGAPLPSRLEFVPIILNAIQWFAYLTWFSSRLGRLQRPQKVQNILLLIFGEMVEASHDAVSFGARAGVLCNRFHQVLGPSIVQKENSLTYSPKRGCSKFVGPGAALDNIVRQLGTHMVHQEVRIQVRVLVAQGVSVIGRGSSHGLGMAKRASHADKQAMSALY